MQTSPFGQHDRRRRRARRFEALEDRLNLDSTVVFNEIMYHPADEAVGTEWVELHNQMAVNMDVSRWTIEGIGYRFPENTVIPGRGYIVVAQDPVKLEPQVDSTKLFGPYSGRLSNAGETLTLRNISDRVMDVIQYSDDSPWPVGADGTGASLAKRDPQSGSARAVNWTTSYPDGGTPGLVNFAKFDPTPKVTTLIAAGSSWHTHDSDVEPQAEWPQADFNDTSWPAFDATLYAGTFPTIEPPDRGGSRAGTSIVIQNASFEANTNDGVGYGEIEGWTSLGTSGLNPSQSGDIPFADNGVIPDGGQVAFIQGRGSLSQIIDGLEVGAGYWLELHYNARSCCGAEPTLVVSYAGSVLVAPTPVSPVRDDNPYHVALVPFTADAESGQLLIRNVSAAGDHSLLLDAIAIVPRDESSVQLLNSSFEASGPPAPGDLTGRSLAGWTYEGDGSFGVADDDLTDEDGVILDNGRIPEGHHVGFLQGLGSLWQTINDLELGELYEVSYRVNARGDTTRPKLTVKLDEVILSDKFIDAVGEDRAFHRRSHRFLAPGRSATIAFSQTFDSDASDATVLIDDIVIRPVTSPLVSEVSLGPSTHYFRHEFSFNGNPAQTDLILDTFLDDGAVIYLNGEEIHRQNLPAGTVTPGTLAQETVGDPVWARGFAVPSESLMRGRNVLAVEVHQATANDPDMAFDLELVSIEHPLDLSNQSSSLRINELTAADTGSFSLELINSGGAAVDLSEYELIVAGRQVTLPAVNLPAGQMQVVSATLPVDLNDLVALRNRSANALVDAVRVGQFGQIRFADGTGPWFNTTTPSLGMGNQAELSSSVVINEIMYHHLPQLPEAGQPPTFERATLIALDGTWRYNQAGENLPADWHKTAHPVAGNWQSGAGMLGFETGRVISPGLGTELNDIDIITYYFESSFNVSAQELQSVDDFQLRHVIDDGVIFYLNGMEFFRFNMPDGAVDATTEAERSINNAELSEYVSIPRELLVAGQNRLSAELHQSSRSSSDVIFGAEVSAARIIDKGFPPTPFAENDEEWIELYNRGDTTVDVSGWTIADAIDFRFEDGTTIGPDQYLVVANDPVSLAQKYPGIEIVGGFRGRLANDGDRIVLRNALGNPVDEVAYFDEGRWSSAADGGGATLELMNPFSDNSVAESWTASQTRPGVDWQTYAYRAIAAEPSGFSAPPGDFHELIIGLLDEGEVLLDDIRLVEDPDGEAVDRLQNGSFESDALGESPAAWRIIGNHRDSVVVADPDDAQNRVLRLSATGATEHMHNHGETTLADGARIDANQEYEISFRAKWLSGSPQVNTRLYFNRAARTTILQTSDRLGTPGARNSSWSANVGPTYQGLTHSPVIPAPDEPVSVSIDASDPHGISQMVLHYALDREPFIELPMSLSADGKYRATIPGQSADGTVQFYITGTDTLGVESQFPRRGAESRAMYVVGPELDRGQAHSMRLIMTRSDISLLHQNTNVMSNGRLGATLIYNDREVFYDVAVRLRASGFGRGGQLAGFNIRFDPEQLFRGVHRSIALDRGTVLSNGNGTGGVRGVPGASPHELLIYQVAHHAGGIPGMYDDVVYIDAPRSTNSGLALLKMARYTDVYLESQFENGGEGSLFKYELIYYSDRQANRNPEAVKRSPNRVVGTDISDLGDDKEEYRMNFVLKSNRARDDFDSLIRLGKAFSLRGDEQDAASQVAMDVDQWMRVFAMQSLVGTADTYNMGLAHNLMLYERPSDGKMLAFPWDVDHGFFYSSNSNILGRGGSNLQRIINLPHNRRLFYKHLLDIVQTTYNSEYLTPWAQHYSAMTGQDLATFFVDYIDGRASHVLSRLQVVAPPVPFEITSNAGQPFQVDDVVTTLEGTGWIDVHTIRLDDSDDALSVRWLDQDRWQVSLPLAAASNELRLQAFDYQDNLVGSDTITVTSTIDQRPLRDHLRVVEIMYNPPDPSADELAIDANWNNEDFEFIELMNVSDSVSLNLQPVRFTHGPASVFSFSDASVQSLDPGQRLVLVNNPRAFAARYGDQIVIGGQFDGNLRNSGERIRFEDGVGGTLVDFTYDDAVPWPAEADGDGFSLELIDPQVTPTGDLGNASLWRSSQMVGGTPTTGPVSGDLNQDGQLTVDDINHFCTPPANHPGFDLNGDGQVSSEDLTVLIERLLGTRFGDANLDNVFDSSDLVLVFQAGQYEDGLAANSNWSTGDWNCDGEFDSGDLVRAFQAGGYVSGLSPQIPHAFMAAALDADRRSPPAHQHERAVSLVTRLQEPPARMQIPRERVARDLIFEDRDLMKSVMDDADWVLELNAKNGLDELGSIRI